MSACAWTARFYDLSEEIQAGKERKSTTSRSSLTVLSSVRTPRGRITDSVETALGAVRRSGASRMSSAVNRITFSQNYACDDCGISIEELYPENVLVQQPVWRVPGVHRSGHSEARRSRPRHSEPPSFHQAGRYPRARLGERRHGQHRRRCTTTHSAKSIGFTLETPIKEFSEQALDELLYGTRATSRSSCRSAAFRRGVMRQPFEGIIPNLERRYRETNSEWSRGEIEEVMSESPCPACHGRRLRPEVLAVTLGGLNIAEFAEKSVVKAMEFLTHAQADRNAAQDR